MGSVDSYTKLLLHMDGAEDGTSFIDEIGHAITAYGNAKTKIAAGKFGKSAGLFDGTGDYLRTDATHADLALGTGDFTLDCWIKVPFTQNAVSEIFSNKPWAANAWGIMSNHSSATANKVSVWSYNHNAGAAAVLQSTTSVNTLNWVHVALVRLGNEFTLYINGIAEATHTIAESFDGGGNQYAYIGGNGTSQYMLGYIEELRLSVGIARWTGNFVPPSNPYGYRAFLLNRRDRFRAAGISLG
jgi:hypothetical protein